jgi:hypothetical protein
MQINTILAGENTISEFISEDILIKTPQDALDLIGNLETDFIILYDHNFEKDFFDLSTRKLGEILQKFTNYRIKLAIVGDFDKYPSKVLKAFIYESNAHREYLFVPSKDQVIKIWQKITV